MAGSDSDVGGHHKQSQTSCVLLPVQLPLHWQCFGVISKRQWHIVDTGKISASVFPHLSKNYVSDYPMLLQRFFSLLEHVAVLLPVPTHGPSSQPPSTYISSNLLQAVLVDVSVLKARESSLSLTYLLTKTLPLIDSLETAGRRAPRAYKDNMP